MAEATLPPATRRVQGVLIAFFVLTTAAMLAIARLHPDLYGRDLATLPRWAGPPLILVLLAADALLIAGILRRWHWLFWALLLVFGVSAVRVPLLPVQLAGLLPGGDPAWYALLQAAVNLAQAAIAITAGRRKGEAKIVTSVGYQIIRGAHPGMRIGTSATKGATGADARRAWPHPHAAGPVASSRTRPCLTDDATTTCLLMHRTTSPDELLGHTAGPPA